MADTDDEVIISTHCLAVAFVSWNSAESGDMLLTAAHGVFRKARSAVTEDMSPVANRTIVGWAEPAGAR